MEGWDKFIENRIEKDIELLLEKYIMEYNGNVKDEKLLDLVENDNYIVENEKKSVSKESYNVYISNRKGMAIRRL